MDAKTVSVNTWNYFHLTKYPNDKETNILKKVGLGALKFISYFTVIVPLIMLAIHHRSTTLALAPERVSYSIKKNLIEQDKRILALFNKANTPTPTINKGAQAETDADAKAKAKSDADAKAKADADAKSKADADAKAKAKSDADAKAKADADAKSKADADAKAKAKSDADAKAKADADAKSKADAKVKAETAQKAKENTSKVIEFSLLDTDFFKAVQKWLISEGIFDYYSTNFEILLQEDPISLQEELLGIHKQIKQFIDEANTILKNYKQEKISRTDHPSDQSMQQLTGLVDQQKRAMAKCQEMLNKIVTEKPSQQNQSRIIGLGNIGTSCYINSALQPLLAIQNFQNLVPNEIHQKVKKESPKEFQGRQNIFNAFKAFLNAWNAHESPGELGKLIGKLRAVFFDAGLAQGGFTDKTAERRTQDAGSFFELLLYVIDQGFELTINRTFPTPTGGMEQLEENNTNSVLILKQNAGTIQEKLLSEYRSQGIAGKLDEPLRRQDLQLSDFTEFKKITSQPPEVLVIRVENHKVDSEKDLIIDCACLFIDDQTPQLYELSGFAQNHNQAHWTSVIREGDGWKYCNDSYVGPLNPNESDFKHPANYLVYRKIA